MVERPVDRAMAIIAERAMEEGGGYDQQQTYWWLLGILYRDGEAAVMAAAANTPFATKRQRAKRGYA